MAVELATAYVSIVPSTKGIAGQLRQQMAGPMEQEGERSGQRFGGAMTGMATKALKVGAGAVVAGFGAALVKGFGRLQALDDARFKLQGLGHDAATVDQIMENALGSVKGTAFGLGDAATIAASAVAAGIKPGRELQEVLSLTGDAATIAGVGLGEMGQIFGKVAAGNRMMTEEMYQLQDRGIPVLSYLQEQFNITALEAREMVSKGQVDFETFRLLLENNIGGAALTAGEAFRGSFANMGAALGRFGAAILGPAFARAPAIFASLTSGLDSATNALGPLAEGFVRFKTPITVVSGLIAAVFIPHLVALAAASTASAARQVAAWVVTQVGAVKAAAIHSASVVKMVAGWVLAGAQALIQGARMAAGWVLAMGPVGWVIAGVVGLVALIIANWDKVVGFTRTMGERVSAIFTGLRDSVVEKVTALVDRVRQIKSDILGFFSGARSWLLDAGKNIINGLISGIGSMARALSDKVSSVITSITDRLPWSPAKKGPLAKHPPEKGGANIVAGIARGMAGQIGTLSAMANAAARAAMPGAAVNVPRVSGVRAGTYSADGGDPDRLKADRINQRLLSALERMTATPLITAQRSAELVHG